METEIPVFRSIFQYICTSEKFEDAKGVNRRRTDNTMTKKGVCARRFTVEHQRTSSDMEIVYT